MKTSFFLSILFLAVNSAVCPSRSGRNITYYVVSDLYDWVVGPDKPNGGNAVQISSPAWTANIPGATWIWGASQVSQPTQAQTSYFYKEFYIPGIPVSGSLTVSADNNVLTYLNGAGFGCDNTSGGSFNSGSENTCDASSMLVPGFNYFNATVSNIAQSGGSASSNPAGLLYKLRVTYRVDDGL